MDPANLRGQVMPGSQAEPLLFRLHHIKVCVLLFRESGRQPESAVTSEDAKERSRQIKTPAEIVEGGNGLPLIPTLVFCPAFRRQAFYEYCSIHTI